jgi:hypothetical protein
MLWRLLGKRSRGGSSAIPVFENIDSLLKAGYGACGNYFFHDNRQKQFILVFFNGAINGERYGDTPVFNRWRWGAQCRHPVICVSDPAVTTETGLQIDWFVGRRSEWALEKIWRTLDYIRSVVAPGAEFIVMGSSGGGFAALQSSMMGHAKTCFCINPQIELRRFQTPARYAEALRYYNDGADSREIAPAHLHRFSVTEAAKKRRHRGATIFYAQNRADTQHYSKHFLPFLKEFAGKSHNVAEKIHCIAFDDRKLKHAPPKFDDTLELFGEPFRRLMK